MENTDAVADDGNKAKIACVGEDLDSFAWGNYVIWNRYSHRQLGHPAAPAGPAYRIAPPWHTTWPPLQHLSRRGQTNVAREKVVCVWN